MSRLDSRPYITVTFEFFDHPKTVALTPAAQLHILRLWAYCGRYLTDGEIPRTVLESAGKKVAQELITHGWVDELSDGTLVCHDYLEHQPSRDDVEERMEKKRDGRSRGGSKGMHTRWHVNRGVIEPKCPLCPSSYPDN